MGALGVSLGGMVANLSAAKRGWDEKLSFFSGWAVVLTMRACWP